MQGARTRAGKIRPKRVARAVPAWIQLPNQQGCAPVLEPRSIAGGDDGATECRVVEAPGCYCYMCYTCYTSGVCSRSSRCSNARPNSFLDCYSCYGACRCSRSSRCSSSRPGQRGNAEHVRLPTQLAPRRAPCSCCRCRSGAIHARGASAELPWPRGLHGSHTDPSA